LETKGRHIIVKKKVVLKAKQFVLGLEVKSVVKNHFLSKRR
jgi:hypothetical protein